MRLLVLTDQPAGGPGLLPPLEFLGHDVTTDALAPDASLAISDVDIVVVDATGDLRLAMAACRQAATHELRPPVMVVAAEQTLAVLRDNWGFDDWLLASASPGEIEARLRLIVASVTAVEKDRAASIGDLVVDEDSYQVRLRGTPLDLTYKEFELLKTLATHPNRVFSRDLLLKEVWGYDYYGGSRTIDVHVRRLRAKFGPEHDHLIETVRGVGYKLVPPGAGTHDDA